MKAQRAQSKKQPKESTIDTKNSTLRRITIGILLKVVIGSAAPDDSTFTFSRRVLIMQIAALLREIVLLRAREQRRAQVSVRVRFLPIATETCRSHAGHACALAAVAAFDARRAGPNDARTAAGQTKLIRAFGRWRVEHAKHQRQRNDLIKIVRRIETKRHKPRLS